MTIRAPLIAPISGRSRSVDLLTWVHSQQIPAAAASVMMGAICLAPMPARPQNLELRTWTNDLPPGVIALTIPAGQRQRDWPNPVLPKPNLDLRFWSDGLPPGVLSLTIPAGQRQRDWPNPVLAKPNLDLRTWAVAQQIQPAVTAPTANRDFAVPARTNWRVPDITQNLLGTTLAPTASPVVPPIWSMPISRKGFDYSWASAMPQVALALPPATYDFQNPVLRKDGADLRTWIDGLPQSALSLTIPDGQKQQDWPNPVLRSPNLELRTYTQNLLELTLYSSPVPYLLAQFDWPNPIPKPPNLQLYQWSQGYSYLAPEPPVPVPPDNSGGGGPQWNDTYRADYQYWLERAHNFLKAQAERRQQIRIEAEAIEDPAAREIATLLKKQEVKDAERAELAELQRFADLHPATPSPQMAELIERAATARTNTALLTLQREMARMDEEEEALSIALLTLLQ